MSDTQFLSHMHQQFRPTAEIAWRRLQDLVDKIPEFVIPPEDEEGGPYFRELRLGAARLELSPEVIDGAMEVEAFLSEVSRILPEPWEPPHHVDHPGEQLWDAVVALHGALALNEFHHKVVSS